MPSHFKIGRYVKGRVSLEQKALINLTYNLKQLCTLSIYIECFKLTMIF